MQCRKNGVLPITDERMTRFWITLGQGVQFVLDSLARMHGGEIFVPKIPSMSIMDVAKVVAPECRTQTIGIRPGEKLHEVLITGDDAAHTVEFSDHYVIQPNDVWWDRDEYVKASGGKTVLDGFQYSSDANPVWMTGDQLKALLGREIIET
jgi:UDP-N-acetylglucosamine 4,6-dehydratase